MKTFLGYFFSSVYVLCASFCGCPDDSDYNYVFYESEIPNLVSIDGNTTLFNRGDTLYLTINIPNRIETLEGEFIDIQDNLGTLSSPFALQLKKMGAFQNPSVQILSEEEVILELGELYFDEYDETVLRGSALFDNERYVCRIGIILKDSGNFLLSQQNQSTSSWGFFFYDEKIEDDTYEDVFVNSPLTQIGSTATGFAFTVE